MFWNYFHKFCTRGGTRTHNPEGHGFLDRCVYLIPPLTHIFKERLAGRQGLEPWASGLEPEMLLYYTNDPYYLHVLKDSNPRGPCDPNGFGDHLFQPLTQARVIHSTAGQFRDVDLEDMSLLLCLWATAVWLLGYPDLNRRPLHYQCSALTSWAISQY